MRHIFLIYLFTTVALHSFSQTKALEFQTDNDVYTFKATRDEYYTNGFYLRFSHLINQKKDNPKLQKTIRTYSLNHRIFTSDTITRSDLNRIDRPYAGQLSGSFAQAYFFKNNTYLKGSLELGWMGPSLHTKEFQHTYHGLIGLYKPKGWNSEINDTPIINFYIDFIKNWYAKSKFEILSESNFAFGTVFNNIKQGIILRYGKQNALHSTSFIGGNLGIQPPEKKLKECYFFISPNIEYVIYNSTIDGNFIGAPSVLTFPSIDWVFTNKIGLAFAWKKFDLNITHFYKTIEVPKGRDHQYVAILFRLKF